MTFRITKGFTKRAAGLVLAVAMVMTGGAGLFTSRAKADSTLEVYDVQSCHTESTVASMTVNGTKVPVINYTVDYDYAQFSFDGKAEIKITVNEDIERYSVSPLAKNIEATANGKTLTFTITESLYMIVKINGIKEIAVLADSLETDVPPSSGTGIYNITKSPYNADSTGSNSVTNALQTAIDNANAAGGGTVYVPKGLYKLDGNIVLKSNVDIYLEGGAVIRSVSSRGNFEVYSYKDSLKKDVTWTFRTELGADNIKIYGRGMIDGDGHDMLTGSAQLLSTLFYIRQATNFTMDGITIRDGNFWTVEPKLCEYVNLTNLKIINGFRDMTENDAIDVCESRHVLVKHVFAISEDDTYSTKTYTASGAISSKGEVSLVNDYTLSDVVFDDCFGWTNCGTFKVGDGSNYEQSDVTFKNSYSYKCMQAIKVSHAYGGAEYKNILFENIDIEGFGGRSLTDRRWLLVDTFSGSSSDNGNIEGLTIKNINIRDLGSKASTLKGRSNQAYVKGVTFENIKVPGQDEYASTLEEMNITDINSEGASDYKIYPMNNSGTSETSPNLALESGVTVTASSVEQEKHSADKAIDGNDGTRWASNTNNSEWLTIDFGKSIGFDHITLKWEAAYASQYKLQYSNDNATWTDIVSVTNGAGGTEAFEFDRVKARYVRFLGVARATKYGYSLYEMEVYDHYYTELMGPLTSGIRVAERKYTENVLKAYTAATVATYEAALSDAKAVLASGDVEKATSALSALKTAQSGLTKRSKPASNLALNKSVTVSGTQNDNSKAANAVDGKTGSCWRSQVGYDGNYWIIVDLGSVQTFDLVVLNWEDCFAKDYKLSVSNDKTNWTDVTVDNKVYQACYKKSEQYLYLDNAQQARYVRMYCFEKATYYGVGVYELEVYDAEVSAVKADGNVALGKTATATTYDPQYTPSEALDGICNNASRWGRNAANKGQDQQLTVDLGNDYVINNIIIKWESLTGTYSIEVSEDGTTWTTVVAKKSPSTGSFTTDDGKTKEYTSDTFGDVNARYIRLNMTPTAGTSGNYYLSVYELEAYYKA